MAHLVAGGARSEFPFCKMTTELTNGVHKTSFPLEELSAKISKNAGIVTQHLATNHLPQPSFNDDGPSVILPTGSPQEVLAARQDLIGASLELLQLAIGPSEFLPNLAIGVRAPCKQKSLTTLTDGSINTFPAFNGFVNSRYSTWFP